MIGITLKLVEKYRNETNLGWDEIKIIDRELGCTLLDNDNITHYCYRYIVIGDGELAKIKEDALWEAINSMEYVIKE